MRILRYLAPAIAAAALLTGCQPSSEPIRVAKPTEDSSYTYEDCRDQLNRGVPACYIAEGEHGGITLVGGYSRTDCDAAHTYSSDPAICVVIQGPSEGYTVPVTVIP